MDGIRKLKEGDIYPSKTVDALQISESFHIIKRKKSILTLDSFLKVKEKLNHHLPFFIVFLQMFFLDIGKQKLL